MKKTITTVLVLLTALIGSSAFILQSNNGIAGYTGSPGEITCSGNGSCHGGGSSATSGITITAVPAFSVNINSDTEYMPDTTYQITVQASAAGFTRYGFGCEVLNTSNTNAGTLQNAGTGVKFLNSGGKRNAVHTTPKTGNAIASFTFKWVAPSGGDATFYAIANAVNGNNNTGGDFVIPPVSMNLVAAPTPTPPPDTSTVGLKENYFSPVTAVSVYPNPAASLTNISYYSKTSSMITVELIDIKGVLVKQLYKQEETPGQHSQLLNIAGIESGVYFIRLLSDNKKVSQKLVSIQ